MNKHESAPNQMLKTARLEKCWTLAIAAEKANVSIEAYSRWELGKQEPRLSSLLLLSEAFGKSPEELGFGRLTKQLHPQEEQKEMVAAPLKEREQLLPEASGSTAPKLLEISIVALSLVQQQQRWSYEELLAHVETAIRRPMTKEQQEQNQRGGKLSRRQIISLMMSVPVVAFGLTEGDDAALLRDDEVLALCAVNIPLAWRLYFAGGLAEVRQMLPDYLARVSALAKQPSRYQQQAAALTSQAHQLAYLLALQNQNFGEARTHTRQSLQSAEIAHDPNLRVASLVRQGNLAFTLKQPMQTIQKYQEAVQNSTGASPLLLGQAYIG
ncbi:MAG TPA: helix-turn-helix transcriptional regulator, partial [Ktedonobacteraceae bacterium]|nr:helix-turn-helix transcriptional regulator [Ktedonobacteraceae bacterium]